MPRSSCLINQVNYAEASSAGSLQDFAFFDKVWINICLLIFSLQGKLRCFSLKNSLNLKLLNDKLILALQFFVIISINFVCTDETCLILHDFFCHKCYWLLANHILVVQVRKALGHQGTFESFMRICLMYNNEVWNKHEVILLSEPILSLVFSFI